MKFTNLFFVLLLILSPLFAETDSTLDVMSFNIRYGTAQDGANSWPYRDELVFAVLQDHDPDIVGLQEALKFQIDAILANVPAYSMLGVGRDDGDSLGEYSAILYKPSRFEVKESNTFWFSDTPDVIASKSWGNDIVRICTWAHFSDKVTGKSFYIYNLHLDHRSQTSRVKSTELLAKKIAGQAEDSPFIVTGDFNAGEDNQAITFLKNPNPPEFLQHVLPFTDSFRVIHPEKAEVGTFNGFEGEKTGDKIDYVFVSAHIKVLHAAIIHDNKGGHYPSDHFPVHARLLLD
ncbi:endonuclease/exonuclease/phosphatase family protein [candidate division KSB1 bacterium]|nr:endonuclease/exonuclease/phosphatase family protein [candidate division KSB1 bacterium]